MSAESFEQCAAGVWSPQPSGGLLPGNAELQSIKGFLQDSVLTVTILSIIRDLVRWFFADNMGQNNTVLHSIAVDYGTKIIRKSPQILIGKMK